ncbi:glycerophosphodiester phosphodiesterase family protein [Dysgonomonas sp. ZJ709]|uniref:glycerophosphodiester phosphodiesterase family protein n=1 Tax=Dysgonomonas sp. ZJ709 TaxID=2709797 RepID=UPI0013EB24B3|nr:glycerophosphodiester phosphodiesterase family protein [Dysgonomonas sp. ZJ709]
MRQFILKFLAAILLLMATQTDVFAQQRLSINQIVHIIKNQRLYPNYNLVAAHRGYWADSPENSLGAYQKAIEIGADIVEMDVRLTKDNEMVIFHDACLDRVTNGYGKLRDENWSYVSSLNLIMPDGTVTTERVLRLSDALDALNGKAVASIDIKEGGAAFNETMIRVITMVRQKNMLNQTLIKGKLSLADLQSQVLAPAGVTLSDFIYTPIAFSNTTNLENYINSFAANPNIYAFELVYKQSDDFILNFISILQQSGIWIGQYSFWPETSFGVFAEKIPLTDCDVITRDYNFLDNPNSPPNAWDDGRGDWDWLLSKGANYIITDRGELMIDYLNEIGKRTR